jgi:hypothetical protein
VKTGKSVEGMVTVLERLERELNAVLVVRVSGEGKSEGWLSGGELGCCWKIRED